VKQTAETIIAKKNKTMITIID